MVHNSVLEIAERDIRHRHVEKAAQKEELDVLHIDPGGMIMVLNEPKEKVFQGSRVAVKPEHILNASLVWNRHRILDEALPSGEKVIKVYLSRLEVAVVPESLYNEIGAWLALSKGEGYVARMEIVEAMSDVPNVIIIPPPSNGEA
jgi:hypothetical protein